jgi:Zn finger protein HypA/HybF involved in hydrogenase expression
MAELEVNGREIKMDIKEIELMCELCSSFSWLYTLAVLCECGT